MSEALDKVVVVYRKHQYMKGWYEKFLNFIEEQLKNPTETKGMTKSEKLSKLMEIKSQVLVQISEIDGVIEKMEDELTRLGNKDLIVLAKTINEVSTIVK